MAPDHQLIADLGGKDRELALAELIARYGRMVERTARRMVVDSQAADDICQAVFLVLIDKASGLRREGSIGGWLHRTTVLIARDSLRSEQRRRHREQEAVKRMHQESTRLPSGFDEALERLPAIYRHAIELRYLEGRSASEIAESLGMKPSAIDMRISRGLRRLRSVLVGATPSLTVAALAQLLAEESAHAAAAALPASLTVAAVTTAGAKPAVLAKGALNAMYLIKLKVIAVAVFATVAVATTSAVVLSAETKPPKKDEVAKKDKTAGALAGLPSQPGPHIARIKALKDGEWIDLGTPTADPKFGLARGRSWSARMSYAPEYGGAFYVGQGVHGFVKPDGRFMDDMFFYDLNANRWICVYPGTGIKELEEKGKSGDYQINDIGQLIDKQGEVVPAMSISGHSYQWHCYDSDHHLWAMGQGWFGQGPCPGFDGGAYGAFPWAGPYQRKSGKDDLVRGTPIFFNAATGKFERYALNGTAMGPYPTAPFSFVLHYAPSLKKILLLINNEGYTYDPATHQGWTPFKVSGPNPNTYDTVSCYDSKRDGIWMWNHFYDVKTATWKEFPNKGALPGAWDGAENCRTYDAANDKVIHLTYSNNYAPDKIKVGMHVFDPQTETWSELPPAPFSQNSMTASAFYCPELNAHIFHAAGDSTDNGHIWAFRLKNVKAK